MAKGGVKGGKGKGQKEKAPSSKDKQKIVEDRTFGMKNRNKSKKVQKQVDHIKKQVDQAYSRKYGEKEERGMLMKMKKEEERKKIEERQALFKTAETGRPQNVPIGVDPKSIICEFHKRGLCMKGARCKFSHDLSKLRTTEKRDIYTDTRAIPRMGEDEMVADDGSGRKTDIVCKYFLEAIEQNKYGWFWKCPNGKECKYRHALPPGYVLKSDAAKKPDENKLSLEEYLDNQRIKIVGKTPITPESFAKWKEEKEKEKRDKEREIQKEKENAFKNGKYNHVLSGKDLFVYDPSMFVDDQDAADEIERDETDEEEASAESGSGNVDEPLGEEEDAAKKEEEDIAEEYHDDLLFLLENVVDESLFLEDGDEDDLDLINDGFAVGVE